MKFLILTTVMLGIFLFQRWIAEDGCSYGSFGALVEANWKATLFSLVCWIGLLWAIGKSIIGAVLGMIIWAIILFVACDGTVEGESW